jgi:hypothetical protein
VVILAMSSVYRSHSAGASPGIASESPYIQVDLELILMLTPRR